MARSGPSRASTITTIKLVFVVRCTFVGSRVRVLGSFRYVLGTAWELDWLGGVAWRFGLGTGTTVRNWWVGGALLHCTGTYCGCGCGPADGPRQDNAKQRGGARIHIHNPHPTSHTHSRATRDAQIDS